VLHFCLRPQTFLDFTNTFIGNLIFIEELEETEFGKKSPLNSVYALDGLGVACKTVDDIRWVLLAMKDCLVNQGFTCGDFSVRNLVGKAKQKGMVHLLLFKRQLLQYLSTRMRLQHSCFFFWTLYY